LPAALERCHDAYPQSETSGLTHAELDAVRQHLPIFYVDAMPVRVNGRVMVTAIGLLLQITGQGTITRALVSSRVTYQERVRSAVLRHLG
jgi:hypothetical protein